MPLTLIPQRYVRTCDYCDTTVDSDTSRMPIGWGCVQIDHRDPSHGSVEYTAHICPDCLRAVVDAVNNVIGNDDHFISAPKEG